MSKWGKVRPRYFVKYPGIYKTGLRNANVTPLLFKKKNSKMHSDYFRNFKKTFKS